jgi:hypothetical protein
MKATSTRTLVLSTVLLALAGAVAPSFAADPVGSSGWWQQMDREGRGGNGN